MRRESPTLSGNAHHSKPDQSRPNGTVTLSGNEGQMCVSVFVPDSNAQEEEEEAMSGTNTSEPLDIFLIFIATLFFFKFFPSSD